MLLRPELNLLKIYAVIIPLMFLSSLPSYPFHCSLPLPFSRPFISPLFLSSSSPPLFNLSPVLQSINSFPSPSPHFPLFRIPYCFPLPITSTSLLSFSSPHLPLPFIFPSFIISLAHHPIHLLPPFWNHFWSEEISDDGWQMPMIYFCSKLLHLSQSAEKGNFVIPVQLYNWVSVFQQTTVVSAFADCHTWLLILVVRIFTTKLGYETFS